MANLNNRYIQFYTPGSAAVKVKVQEEHKWAPLPEPKPEQKLAIYVDPIAMVAFAVAICMLVLMAVGIYQLNGTRREVAALEGYVAQLSAQNHELKETYSEGYDLEDVRKAALDMGLVPVEEISQSYIYITMPQLSAEEPVTLWQQVTTFLAGLFA